MLEARELFRILWEEVDFDDHPVNGGHGPNPEGELQFFSTKGSIHLKDERIYFQLYTDYRELVDAKAKPLRDSQQRPISIHLLSEKPMLSRPPPGRLGLHRWSVDRSMLSSKLWNWIITNSGELISDDISELDDFCLFPDLSSHEGMRIEKEVSTWRESLQRIRTDLILCMKDSLQDWTWHLEIDNKADRLGWYIRCPVEWNSLFTIFAGFCWNPNEPENLHGMLLFERAPEGELDRDDEADANLLDIQRTTILCSKDGPLSKLANNPAWSESESPYMLEDGVQLWPPKMGRWPLIYAVSAALQSEDDTIVWLKNKAELIIPIIDTLKTL